MDHDLMDHDRRKLQRQKEGLYLSLALEDAYPCALQGATKTVKKGTNRWLMAATAY